MKPVELTAGIDAEEYGGKAAALAAAARIGLPVPRGIALPASFVEAVVQGDGAALAELDPLYSGLATPVAVRSSAFGEDSAQASFAGQHVTRLNIRSPANLREAVQVVWLSASSESARV